MNCRVCNVELTDENWNPSQQKNKDCICKVCASQKTKEYYNKNKDLRGGYHIKYAKEHAEALKEYRKNYYNRQIERRIHNFFKYLWGDFCVKCGIELNDMNWGVTRKNNNNHICKNCDNKRHTEHCLTNPNLIDYPKKYYQANKEKMGEYYKKWREKHPEYKNKQQLPHIKEKAKRKYREDIAENRDKYLEAWAKRKGRGFIPLNEYFDGADGHHIDDEHVIFMPMCIHRSIPHDHRDTDSMWTINCMALLWLFYGSIPEVDMKLPDWIFQNGKEYKHKQLTLF